MTISCILCGSTDTRTIDGIEMCVCQFREFTAATQLRGSVLYDGPERRQTDRRQSVREWYGDQETMELVERRRAERIIQCLPLPK